jgi:hypothetical protein
MKGNRKLLYVALAGLLATVFTGAAFGFNPGPNGNGGGGEASNGTQNQAQNHQCCPELTEVLGVDLEYTGTQTRSRDGSCGGEPGPNQNPYPGFGEGHSGPRE